MRIIVYLLPVLLIAACNNTSNETTSVEPIKQEPVAQDNTPRVTGIGGIFFKCKDPAKMKDWYAANLGLKTDEYGSTFEFRTVDAPDQPAYLQWSPFSDSTDYFKPSEKEFMINYRVANLEKLIEELRADGVQIVGEIQTFDYGKFAHIMDPEGNKIELWEPVDAGLSDYAKETTH